MAGVSCPDASLSIGWPMSAVGYKRTFQDDRFSSWRARRHVFGASGSISLGLGAGAKRFGRWIAWIYRTPAVLGVAGLTLRLAD
jgi:hypothetical protein